MLCNLADVSQTPLNANNVYQRNLSVAENVLETEYVPATGIWNKI